MVDTDELYPEYILQAEFKKQKGSDQIASFTGVISFTRGALNGTRNLKT
jgi:hypothetical protein